MEEKSTLKAFRESRGLTQQALADRLGVAKNYIYLVESGRKPMTAGLRRKLDALEHGVPNPAERLDGETNKVVVSGDVLANIEARLASIEQLLIRYLSSK